MSSQAVFNTEGTYPTINPAWVLFVYVIIPWLPILYNVHLMKRRKDRQWRGGKIYSFVCNLSHYLYQNAPYFAIGQLAWSVVLLANQSLFAYSNVRFAYDIEYYATVNSAAFHHVDAVDYLGSFNSLDALNGKNGAQRLTRRRLQISSIDSNLTLAYHTDSWSNVLTQDFLQSICFTERSILRDPGCINTNYYSSAIPLIFNSRCEYKLSFDNSLPLLGRSDNSLYVTDYVHQYRPQSSVLVSYFGAGTCGAQTPSDFADFLDSHAVNGTTITYTNKDLNKEDVRDTAGNTLYYLAIAFIVAYVILVFGVRGVVIPLITVLAVLLSTVNATALIALMGYKYFSIGNSAGVLITLMYGCSAVNTYGSSWRQQVKKGCHPSIPNILNSYIIFGQRMFYITTLSAICLFSLMGSSVSMINQFGAFTGLSILSFYLILHYLLIPFWLFTSWFTLRKSWHEYLRARRQALCSCCTVLNELGLENFNLAHMLGIEEEEEELSDANTRTPKEEVDDEQSIVQPDRIVFVGEDPNQPAAAADGEVQQAIVAASLVGQEQELGESEPQFEEAQFDTKLCRGKRPLKLIGFAVLLIVLVALAVVYGLTVNKFHLDTGIPRVFPTESNLGRQMKIMQLNKGDLDKNHMSSATLTGVVFNAPTVRPTAAPAGFTLAPTQRPTAAPTLTPPPNSIRYSVKGCWGIKEHISHIDAAAEGRYDFASFKPYVDNGLVADMKSLCEYAAGNREFLSIVPEWNVTTDCIYNQFARAYASLPANLRNNVNGFTSWGGRTETTRYSLGYGSQSNLTYPVWVCANFSVVSNVASIDDDPSLVNTVRSRWEKAFSAHGSTQAAQMGVPTVVSSPAFTYPLLADSQTSFLYSCLAATVVGFVLLLAVFTLGDMGLTVFGSLSIFTILSVSLCLHILLSSRRLDLWDVVIVQSIMLIIVDFPVYLTEEYMAARAHVDRLTTLALDKALSPALSLTNQRVRPAVLAPCLLMVLASVPVLFADLEFLARTSEYIIIVALVSTVMTVFIQPYLLAFGCRTKFFEHLCYVVEDDEDPYDALPAMAAASLPPLPAEDQGYDADDGQDGHGDYAAAEPLSPASMGGYTDDGTVQSGSQSSAPRSFVRHGTQISMPSYAQQQAPMQQHQMMHVPSEMEMTAQGPRTMRPRFSQQQLGSQYGSHYGPQFGAPPFGSQYGPQFDMGPQQQPGPRMAGHESMYGMQGAPRPMNRVPTMQPLPQHMQGPPPGAPMVMSRHPSMVPQYHGPPPGPGGPGPRLHGAQSMYGPGFAPGPGMPPMGRRSGSMQAMPQDMYAPPPPPPPPMGYAPGPNISNLRRGPSHYAMPGAPGPGPGPYQQRPPQSFYDAPQY